MMSNPQNRSPLASYSTVGFSDRNVESALDAIAAVGFTQVEIICQEPHLAQPLTGRALSEFCRNLDRRHLRAPTIHAPLTTNVLGAPDEKWRREKSAVLADYIRFAGQIGSMGIVIHPVPNPIFVPGADDPDMPPRIAQAVRRSLDELVPIAAEHNVCMLLENLPYACSFPLLTMRELRPLADDYPASSVGLVLDTGHAWTIGEDPSAAILSAGPRLKSTHLQDVDYDDPDDQHWAPTHGGLDWAAIRKTLAQVNYQGPWTFEVYAARFNETPEQLAHVVYGIASSWGLGGIRK